MEAGINFLVEEKVLTKVNYSEWATPIVPVIKKGWSVTICGETVNPRLEIDQYPLPKTTDIFASLAGGQKLMKLDLQHAYLQMEVCYESKLILTVDTLYQFNRQRLRRLNDW